ncbi:hypothetical protein ACJKIH_22205 [Brucella pseudogrignonensis]|uniref:hypothetical protein n=1 Tax=Brucella pseudogrignonensis TaxID=419475 RepID=UPI0038B4B8D4
MDEQRKGLAEDGEIFVQRADLPADVVEDKVDKRLGPVDVGRQNDKLELDRLRCTPILGHGELEFSGFKAQSGGDAVEPFISEIGTLLPMALCGRNSL